MYTKTNKQIKVSSKCRRTIANKKWKWNTAVMRCSKCSSDTQISCIAGQYLWSLCVAQIPQKYSWLSNIFAALFSLSLSFSLYLTRRTTSYCKKIYIFKKNLGNVEKNALVVQMLCNIKKKKQENSKQWFPMKANYRQQKKLRQWIA